MTKKYKKLSMPNQPLKWSLCLVMRMNFLGKTMCSIKNRSGKLIVLRNFLVFLRKNNFHYRPTEAETRYTREITSVMMTTSGFISPAREGKLPDAKAPVIPVADLEKPPAKEPPSAAVGTLLSNSVNGVKSEKVKGEKVKSEKVKMKKKSLPAAVLQEKKRKKEKSLQGKLSSMGPPPAKQMPSQAAPIYLPTDTPMSVVAEQQKIGKKPFMPKIPRKHKVKDPNKPPKSILDGKIKKPKKPPKNKNLANVLDELFKVNQPTFPSNVPSMDVKHERSDTSIDLTDTSPNALQNPAAMQHMSEPFASTQQQSSNFMLDGKLSTEPDKRKLNIFKRISSKNKEDAAKQGLPLPPHLNLPETSIFPVDDAGMSSMHSPSLPVNLQVPTKKTPKKSPTMSKKLLKQLGTDLPLNMTVPKPGENVDMSMFLTPKQLKAAARKQMKALKEPKEKKVRVKKEKLKAKDKKLKDQAWPVAATDLSIGGGPSPMIPQRKTDPIPPMNPMLQNLYDQHIQQRFANHLRENLGSMGNLRGAEFMQNFPMYPWSGPGLIPGNPLFPNFPLQPRQRLPFPLPNFEMFGAFPRLKRPHLDKPEPEPMAMPINYEMAQCNVAPLVPASLKLEDITPSTSTNSSLPSTKPSFPSSTSISLVTGGASHQNTKSKPLTPEPRIDNQTIDLTDDPYDAYDQSSPKRVESPPSITSPRTDNSSQMSQMQPKRRSSSSPRHAPSSFNMDDTQSMTDSNVDDADSGNISNKDKSSKLEKRKDKEHKKEKKDKEGKIKKKKDKKDKTKSKEKSEKRKEKEEKHKDKELKLKTKKDKKEKRKEKELARVLCGMASNTPLIDLGVSSPGSDSSIVPKLTLKLGASPRPDTPDSHRKMYGNKISPNRLVDGNDRFVYFQNNQTDPQRTHRHGSR